MPPVPVAFQRFFARIQWGGPSSRADGCQPERKKTSRKICNSSFCTLWSDGLDLCFG
jgi:hypothetical protein